MKRFLRNIAISLAILLAAAWVLDRVMTHVFRGGHGMKSQWQYHMHDQHYDVVIIGSSRAWWNIDMGRMDSACGLRTVNLANNHGRDPESLLSLRLFLANGNTADRVLVQVDHNSLTDRDGQIATTMYEFVPFLEDSVLKDHLRGRAEWTVMRCLPLWRYVKCNLKWGPEEFLATVTDHRRPLFDTTGSYFSDPNFYGADTLRMTNTGHHLSPDLKAIMDLCHERGITLDFFTAPYYNLVGDPKILDAPRRVVEGAGGTFFDYSRRIQGRANFNDELHTSIAGGRVFTDLLIHEVICPDSVVR